MAQRKDLAYLSGRFVFELDGHKMGIVNSVDGGHFKSESIAEQVGGENSVTRYPGRQKFEDITFTVGSAMLPGFWKWVDESIHNLPSRRNGAILALDYDNRVRSRRTFSDALISEIQFPSMDLMAKSPKQLAIKIAPERMKFEQVAGAKYGAHAPDVGPQKRHLPSTFDMELSDISKDAMSWVSKIDQFTVKQNVINNPMGGLLYTPKDAGRIEFPSLSIYTSESHVGPFLKWWEEFVGEGKHFQGKEMHGAINYRLSNLQESLISVDLFGVGITGLTFDKQEAGTDKVRNVKVDLYVENMKIRVEKEEGVARAQ